MTTLTDSRPSYELVPSNIAQALVGLLRDGPFATFSPTPVKDFFWNEEDYGRFARIAETVDKSLRISCKATFEEVIGLIRDDLRNKQCRGVLVDGSTFTAKMSHGQESNNTFFFECDHWLVKHTDSDPCTWIARIEGKHGLSVGNLSVNLYMPNEDGDPALQCAQRGFRLRGHHTYYIVSHQEHDYLVIDTGGEPLDIKHLSFDFMTLEFVAGTRLGLGFMQGLNVEGKVVAHAGGSYGHRRRNGEHETSRPAIGRPQLVESGWAIAFFDATCAAHEQHSEYDLDSALGFYLNSIGDVVDGECIKLHIALEGLALRMVGKAKVYRTQDHKSWLRWCDDNADAIKNLSLKGKETSLFDAVRRADAIGASSVVEVAFTQLDIKLPPLVLVELETRNKLVHEGRLPRNVPFDVDRFVLHADAPRTLLLALIAKAVGYDGPIRGYDKHDSGWPSVPDWWHMGDAPPPMASKSHLVIVGADIDAGAQWI